VKFNCLALLCLLSVTVIAQKDYLITTEGDTLFGKVTLISNDPLDRAQVITTDKKIGFTALQLREVNFQDERFHPAQLGDNVRLMKLIKGGYLSLYAYRVEKETTYTGRLLKKMDGTSVDLPILTFRGALVNFIEDCETLAERVKKRELGRNDLELIVSEYNQCINKSTNIKFQESNKKVSQNKKRGEVLKFLRKIEMSDLNNKNEITEVLNDMLTRLESGKVIPSYQQEALREFLKGHSEYEKELSELLSIL